MWFSVDSTVKSLNQGSSLTLAKIQLSARFYWAETLFRNTIHFERNSPLNFSNRRAGAIIPLLALVVTAMLAIAALTINSNWMLFSQINVQNSADLSARSALVKVIADTEFDGRIDRARSLGGRLYDLNIDRPNHPGFDANEIRFGSVADRAALEPTFVATNSNNFPISAVHVGAPVAQDQREINVFLSTFLGIFLGSF